MKKGPYTVTQSKQIYKNPWIEVQEDKVVGLDGKEGLFATVDNGAGVSVVALDEKQNIYLIKEYYYVLDEYGIQTPSGGINKGENPIEAAKKELLEETGLTAKQWTELGLVNPLTMIIRSPAYLFLAQDLAKEQKPELGMEVIKIPLQKAVAMVLNSQITHAPSCIAILKTKELLTKTVK